MAWLFFALESYRKWIPYVRVNFCYIWLNVRVGSRLGSSFASRGAKTEYHLWQTRRKEGMNQLCWSEATSTSSINIASLDWMGSHEHETIAVCSRIRQLISSSSSKVYLNGFFLSLHSWTQRSISGGRPFALDSNEDIKNYKCIVNKLSLYLPINLS